MFFFLMFSLFPLQLMTDINECVQAARNGSTLCSNDTVCANTPGSYECVCAPGYSLVMGTCQRMNRIQ